MSSSPKVLFGFHAVGVRLKTAPASVIEIYYEPTRRDARMRQFLERVKEAGVRLIEADALRIAKLAGSHGHQGVAARVNEIKMVHSLDDLLDALEGKEAPLILVLDGVTDPHNLGACLRVADGAGAHAVIAPKDHAVGVNATVAKVASGAAETVPYFMVTNLARTLNELKERNIWVIGTSDDAPQTLFDIDLKGPTALVLGADMMIAGGSEAAITRLSVGGFAASRALSTRNDDPATASRPWDKDRDGFVIGEGAGVMVLEEYEHAKKRGAKIYAELSGYGMSADAYHMTAPNMDGPRRSMRNAMNNAGIDPSAVQFINAHGTSTPLGDSNETNAIKAAFGEHAYKLVVNSTKSMTGHLLGGAGGLESVFTVLSIYNQVSPPTINIFNQDPECDFSHRYNYHHVNRHPVIFYYKTYRHAILQGCR